MIGVSVMDKKVTTAELGEEHMRTLKRMAQEEGIITPFSTATGWGNAAVIDNEAIPVTSAYTYPFWEEPRMSPFCSKIYTVCLIMLRCVMTRNDSLRSVRKWVQVYR